MRIEHQFSTTCKVCGEKAFGISPPDWMSTYEHRDPKVCAENIARQKEKLMKQLSVSLENWGGLNLISP